MFSRIFYVIISNEVPVTILQASMSLRRHTHKGMLIRILRQIYVEQLISSNFAKNRENVQGELCLNVFIPFSIIVCLSCRCVMFQ